MVVALGALASSWGGPAGAVVALFPSPNGGAGTSAAPGSIRSTFDAGYQAIVSNSPSKSVATVLTVPTVTCTSPGEFGIYPTAELLNSSRVGMVGVGIAIVCDDGAVTYESADAYADTTNDDLPVAPGDQVQITVQAGSRGMSATVDDLTAHTSTSASAAAGPHPPTYALIGVAPVFAAHRPESAPSFGSVPFSQSTVDGTALLRAKGLVKLERSIRKSVEISTSGLSSFGEAFTAIQVP